MRSYPEDEYEAKEAVELKADPWQLDLLKLNPAYNCWGPGEDYMATGDKTGWSASKTVATWSEFGPWCLDDLNECVNFHFEVGRKSRDCESCDESGYNPATHQISEDFYDFARTGRRWIDKITEDEAHALIAKGRADANQTAEAINAENRPGRRGLGHDAINRRILIEARAKRLGVYGLCSKCDGHGYVYTAPSAHASLVLWMLFPRKGASCGVEIANITREELPAVFAWLREAAKRNAERFAKIPEAGR